MAREILSKRNFLDIKYIKIFVFLKVILKFTPKTIFLNKIDM
jgi:hypothetical protein